MARSGKDLTTKTDARFGPWRPMRGARGQAEAIQQKIGSPYRTAPLDSPLTPPRSDVLRSYSSRKVGGRR